MILLNLALLMTLPWAWWGSDSSGGTNVSRSMLSSMEASATSSINITRHISTSTGPATMSSSLNRIVTSRLTPPKQMFSTMDASAVTAIAITRHINTTASADMLAAVDRSVTSRTTAPKSISSVMDASATSLVESFKSIETDAYATMLAEVGRSSVNALPAAPTGLSAEDGADPDWVALEWTDNADNETGYEVWRSSVSAVSGMALVATLAANSNAYVDTSSSEGTQYWYQVLATNARGDSPTSNVVEHTPGGPE